MTVYVLDTDHVTLHQRGHPQVTDRVQSHQPNDLAVTVITVEEQLRGRLAQIGRPSVGLHRAYDQFRATIDYFCSLGILPFDIEAAQLYQQLRAENIRISTLDLRIAAIVLRQNAILVTRNRRDFDRVPDLRLQYWSQ